MAAKFAIYFGEPLATATAGYENQRSARLNRIAHEWLQMIEGHVPELLPPEWKVLLAVTTGTLIADDATLKHLWAAVADGAAQCQQFGVDADTLAAKLRGLSMAQRYALRETLERTWSGLDAGEDMDAALRLAGALKG